MLQTLSHPELMRIKMPTGETFIGGSQSWYADQWQKMSGCGPTAASNLMWYLARSRQELAALCDGSDYDHFSALQHEMFTFVTPGMGGVNRSEIFTDGVVKYAAQRGITLVPQVLEIPGLPRSRPDADTARDFILSGLKADCPVAFLNLSNGSLSNLEGWHWVTIVALDSDSVSAQISDQGHTLTIDLAQWLKTSILGGAMVWLTTEPHE